MFDERCVTAEEMHNDLKERFSGRKGATYHDRDLAERSDSSGHAEYISAAEMKKGLAARISSRHDIGLWKAVAERLLDPRNPFEPERRRGLQKEIVVVGTLALLLLAAFAYFNFSWP